MAITRWWSDDMSTPLFTLTSCSNHLNFCPMQVQSIWFSVTWSEDHQVALLSLYRKILPPVALLNALKSARSSPFSFFLPSPCLPITCSYPLFSTPVFALKSPVSIFRSFFLSLSSALESIVKVLLPFLCVMCGSLALHYLDLVFFIFVLNLTVMILEPTVSQLMNACCAFFVSIKVTIRCVCGVGGEGGASSSLWPEYRIASPVDSLTCSDCVHLVSHRLSRDTL